MSLIGKAWALQRNWDARLKDFAAFVDSFSILQVVRFVWSALTLTFLVEGAWLFYLKQGGALAWLGEGAVGFAFLPLFYGKR